MDYELRVGLWNVVYRTYIMDMFCQFPVPPQTEGFVLKLWADVMKIPLTPVNPFEAALNFDATANGVREWILTSDWNRVYEIIEFFPRNYPPKTSWEDINYLFRKGVNTVLEQEFAGYRFVGNQLVRITVNEEMQAIEESLDLGGSFTPASGHLRQALQLLSDRESPDYRNSIKESILAVEAACRVVSGKPKATLGDALKAVGDESARPALRGAFEKLYGWTSDAAGIRHAMSGDTSVDFADAQFMVVACSAFTNYLATKSASRSG